MTQYLPGVSQAKAQVLGPSPETTVPVYAARGGIPLVMLTMARDHTLFFSAYNDVSDIDGDGVIDIRFNPNFEYVGLYQPYYCYTYSGSGNGGAFRPDANAIATTVSGRAVPGPCAAAGTQSATWSGNFLNYVTTSRIDALRVALYGGYRDTDTVSSTILRRAYIPQDGHAWAKEYTSVAVDKYDISQYTPLAVPTSSTVSTFRHFFGNLTSTANVDPTRTYTYQGTDYPPVGIACANLSDCSNYPPLLRVIKDSDKRVWQWASSERPVLSAIGGNTATKTYGTGTLTDYTVRVAACTTGFVNGCKAYTVGTTTTYKPIGVLHTYGEDESMYFGLLTGSYDQNLSGGRLRKNISSFKDEINRNGTFANPANSLITQINNIRIRNFNYTKGPDNNNTFGYYSGNYVYRNGLLGLNANPTGNDIFNNSYGIWGSHTGTYHTMQEGEYADWGNPVAEMMYESLRYLGNQGSATGAFSNGITTEDQAVGLATAVAWGKPYTAANWCAKPSQMVISSVNPSFDSDQLPGALFGAKSSGNTLQAADGTSLDVGALTSVIGDASHEGVNDSNRLIGDLGDNNIDNIDGAPTAKTLAKFGQARGLPPDDTNKQGSFYAAAVANFGKAHPLLKFGTNTTPSVDTFAVLMNSPIPQITIPFANGKKISIVPFARTIDAETSTKGNFQPTNQIVGMYIQTLTDPKNENGTYHLNFLINYEDRSWGGDFEMDAVAEYDIEANFNNANIKVTPTYGASGSTQNIGYVISGSDHDGPYLVVQPKNQKLNAQNQAGYYYLNVPPKEYAGYCNNGAMPASCEDLPHLKPDSGEKFSIKTFSPAGNPADNYLKDPLWYAAKWGGYSDGNPPTGPTTADPASYAQVTSPAKLSAAFSNAFQSILDRSSTIGAVGSSSSQLLTDTKLFQASFNQKYFTGDLTATNFGVTTGTGNVADVATYRWAWGLPTQSDSAASLLIKKPVIDRKIYYKNPTPGTTNLLEFSTSTPTLTIGTSSFSSNTVNYLRGDTTNEKRNGGSFRNRGLSTSINGIVSFVPNVLGGIINSAPVYFDSTKTVYVGVNDGMLHGFNSETGEEKFAYIPSAVVPHLSKLSDPSFTHRYFVDGNIAVMGGSKTGGVNYLVGFMGRGAKGLYGLRVDNNGVVTGSGAWENFGANDNDMGYLLGAPVTGFLTDGTPVVVFGNGYNSANDTAVLYVVRVSDGVLLKKFTTPFTNNGLATPGVVLNAGKLQYAYAGDYLGNVWRFDLTGIPGNSVSDNGAGTRKWLGFATPRQPIVAAVAVSDSGTDAKDKDVQKKRFLFFGTGSDLTATDASNTQQQSVYALIDDGGTAAIAYTDLKQRFLNATTGIYTRYRANLGLDVRAFDVPMAGDMAGQSGWFLNWTMPANSASEKVFTTATVRSASTPTLVVSSNIMNNNTCSGSGAGYLNALDAYSGGGLTTSYFDIDRDRSFDNERLGGQAIGSVDFRIGNIGQASFPGNNVVVQGNKERSDSPPSGGSPGSGSMPEGDKGDTRTQGSSKVSRRISWREIVK